MMNKIKGFKAYINMMDQFGNKYELDKEYSQSGDIKFGASGYHFCAHIADVFRYYDGHDENINICEVEGSGKINKYDDEYNEYFDMYSCSNLKILKILSRQEIIDESLHENIYQVLRLIQGFKLTDEELTYITNECSESIVKKYASYYQKDKKDAFQRKRK